MKANELRIGNLITDGGHEVSVNWEYLYSIEAMDLKSTHLNPIPLTEEWLEKFGFESEFSGEFNRKEIVIEAAIRIVESNKWSAFFIVEPVSKPLEYVHQLQNLYFALTGEELTITKTEKA